MSDTRYYGADGKLKWGYPVDVGHLILQLQTLDASMKVSAVTHIEMGDRTQARAFGLSMSRERWDEGGWLNYSLPGPEALAIWASTRDEGLEGLSSLEQQVESLRAELKRLRVRVFGSLPTKATSHTTYCTIWGDNGQGGTSEGFSEPLPCNCGALRNWDALQIKNIEAERDTLLADKERLDWLDQEQQREQEYIDGKREWEGPALFRKHTPITRTTIDAARKPVSQEPK